MTAPTPAPRSPDADTEFESDLKRAEFILSRLADPIINHDEDYLDQKAAAALHEELLGLSADVVVNVDKIVSLTAERDAALAEAEKYSEAYRIAIADAVNWKSLAEAAEDALAEVHKILAISNGAVSNDDIRAIEIITRDATRVRPNSAALPAVTEAGTAGETLGAELIEWAAKEHLDADGFCVICNGIICSGGNDRDGIHNPDCLHIRAARLTSGSGAGSEAG